MFTPITVNACATCYVVAGQTVASRLLGIRRDADLLLTAPSDATGYNADGSPNGASREEMRHLAVAYAAGIVAMRALSSGSTLAESALWGPYISAILAAAFDNQPDADLERIAAQTTEKAKRLLDDAGAWEAVEKVAAQLHQSIEAYGEWDTNAVFGILSRLEAPAPHRISRATFDHLERAVTVLV
jgi:hypothetical protein